MEPILPLLDSPIRNQHGADTEPFVFRSTSHFFIAIVHEMMRYQNSLKSMIAIDRPRRY